VALIGVLEVLACAQQPFERRLVEPSQVGTIARADTAFLKAHMRDGQLYLFSSWTVDERAATVSGQGARLTVDRRTRESGMFTIRIADVALFETNAPDHGGAGTIAPLAVITVGSAALTVLCLTHPKSCFGSCPTFYVSDGTKPLLQAEGFSDAIAPALEHADVDALYRARPTDRRLEVRMTNEALETHVVDAVEVLAVPRPAGGRVFQVEGDGFYQARALTAPSTCDAPEGSCADDLRAFDGRERFSLAGEHDLGEREELTLTFPPAPGGRGLVIAARQTLLTTYLLYQTLAYLGHDATAALSRIDSDPANRDRIKAAYQRLGGIEVLVEAQDGSWTRAGEVVETGPLATDVHLVRLPPAADERGAQRVRLRMTRGNWRLDWVAMAALGARLEPTRLAPSSIAGITGDAGRRVSARAGERIVTLPGDVYTFSFELPQDPERYELFLSSRGYYLEWMRETWFAEESPLRAALLLSAPGIALRLMAPAYKRQEADMDRLFWESRYARP
jgi:hypothetical protein